MRESEEGVGRTAGGGGRGGEPWKDGWERSARAAVGGGSGGGMSDEEG